MTASQEMTCFLPFVKLCDYTEQNFVVGSSNNDDGTYINRSRKKRVKVENYLKVVGSFSLSAQGVYKRVCRKIAVICSFYLFDCPA